VTIPLYASACALALASAPLWIPLAALCDLWRGVGAIALRSCAFLTFYLCCEMAGLLGAGALFLLRPLLRDPARWRALHFRLQDAWATALWRAAVSCFGLRVDVDAREARLGDGPYLLLLRHVSAGDTLLASAFVSRPHGMRLRYVLKRELLWDPCLDVVGKRLGHVFVDRTGADSAREIARVQALAHGLGPREGVLIYPEGTRFSFARRARVLARFVREGDVKRIEYARSLTHVLPPRTGGVLALLEGAPAADVVVCMHRGFERAASLRRIWRGEPLDRRIQVRFLRIPRCAIPASRHERALWLRELWQQVDDWVEGAPSRSEAAAREC
jgi:1-acyl-sn-glycerol-3-phosphate acyltransferase